MFLGLAWWTWALVAVVLYIGCLIGANSPQTFKRSKHGLEAVANKLLAKAKAKALRGG